MPSENAHAGDSQAALEQAEKLMGQRIVAASVEGEFVRIEFEHKGTDDDTGCLAFPLSALHFCCQNSCESCWKEADGA